jgi:hypothetical protein
VRREIALAASASREDSVERKNSRASEASAYRIGRGFVKSRKNFAIVRAQNSPF